PRWFEAERTFIPESSSFLDTSEGLCDLLQLLPLLLSSAKPLIGLLLLGRCHRNQSTVHELKVLTVRNIDAFT
ncbi:MAG: hypothetical protein VXW22_03405, partial [Pseudomonadota bacterium]|nr:hypothetical protein [Pseudomonadota bacterium]